MTSGTASANVYTVTNTSSSAGTLGSLPWAVAQANGRAGLDYIVFDTSPTTNGVASITITSTLPLNDQVVIDGSTQPGSSPAVRVVVRGPAVSPGPLFQLQGPASSGSAIQGMGMYDFQLGGIVIFNGSHANWIQNNWIGFFRDGVNPVLLNRTIHANTFGVAIQSNNNTIRGNTISGTYNAVVIGENPSLVWSGINYEANSITNNRLGTNPGGTTAAGYGNTADGIFLGAGAFKNPIGPNNILSGNGLHGIEMLHSSVVGNAVFRNFIGTDWSGTVAIPNLSLGILLGAGARGNIIGAHSGGNLISANVNGGISLGVGAPWFGANGNWVYSNVLGLDISQTVRLGTQAVGISINNGSTGNDVEYNVLAGNASHGAIIANSNGNAVLNNWIGRSYSGTPISNGNGPPAGGFGLFFLNASFNWAYGNLYGTNVSGPCGHSGTFNGNTIDIPC